MKAESIPQIAFVTMGCAKNEVDTLDMKEALLKAGYALTDEPENADAIVVNTCSFIQSATEESIDAIFEALELPRQKAGQAKLIVAGCMVSRYGDDLRESLPEADTFVPCDKEKDIVSVMEELFPLVSRNDTLVRQCFEQRSDAYPCWTGVSAYVKISDGCDRFCAYCAIPYIRGRYHSFSFEQIYENVAQRIAEGAKEIVLIAQDTGRWGQDFQNPSSLADLLDALSERYPSVWFRVLYIQPEGIDDKLLDVMAARDNVCSYLDIPLQHCNERILRSMRRKGSAEQFNALFDRILKRIPNVTLRTTLIAGYPGETEEDFEELCDFIADSPFDYVGVFSYSREEGTKAYDLPDQVEEDVKMERTQRLRDLADDVCSKNIARRIGTSMPILIEGREEDGQLFGRAMCQAPEVDGVTYVDAGEVGEIVTKTIIDTLLYEMEAE